MFCAAQAAAASRMALCVLWGTLAVLCPAVTALQRHLVAEKLHVLGEPETTPADQLPLCSDDSVSRNGDDTTCSDPLFCDVSDVCRRSLLAGHRAPFAKSTADAVSFKAHTSPPLTSTVSSSRGQPVVDTTPQPPRSSSRPTSAATPNTHQKSATFTSAVTVWFDTATALAGLVARSCLILCAACLLSPGPLPVLGIVTGTSVKPKREALVCVLLLASVAGAASTSTSTTATPSPASSPQPVCVTTGSSEPVCRCDCSCDDPPPCATSPTSPMTPASPTSPAPDDFSTEPAASPTSEVSPRPKCRLCLVPTVRLVRKGH